MTHHLRRARRAVALALIGAMYAQPLAQNVWVLNAAALPIAIAPPLATGPEMSSHEDTAAEQATPGPVVVFGPNQYVRTSGPPNIYTASFSKPAWMTGPFAMRVVNGSPEGTNRLSSTTILLNGVEVAVPTDFSQQVAGFDRVVTLLEQNAIELHVTSIPEGYLTLWFLAHNADHTAPQLSVGSPANGAVLNHDPVAITVNAADVAGAGEPGASGLNTGTFQVSIDGINRTGDFTIANGVATAQIGGLAPGAHTVSATVSDVAGNAANSTSTFTIDRAAPQIAITTPAAGQYTNATSIEVRGTLSDSSATMVTVDGAPASVGGGQFVAAAVPVGTGPSQTIAVVATDAAGNTTTATVTINIDRASPEVTIASPVAGQYTNATSLAVSGAVSDSSPTSVVVDGVAAAVNAGQYVATVPVGAGPSQTISVVATDAAANVATAAVTITIDRAAPEIAIAHPAPGQYTNATTIEVRGTIADGSVTNVVVDGVAATVTAGEFVAVVPVGAGPAQTISVVATDAAGNAATSTVAINVDRAPPQLAITAPAAGLYTNAGSVEVRGSVADGSATTVVVDSVAAEVSGGQFAATVPLGAGPAQAITAVATDASGNTTTASVTINIDRAAPQLVITSPAAAQFTNALSVPVSGTVVDDSPTTVQVDGLAANVAGAQFAIGGVAVGEGPSQVITATATDAAGNTATATVTINVDRAAPQISITAPTPNQYSNAASIEVRGAIVDGSATNVLVDGVAAVVTGTEFVAAAVPLADGPTQTITVIATDAAGNPASASVTINIDRAAPQVVIVSPSEGQFTNAQAIEVRGGVIDTSATTVVVDGVAAAITDGEFVAAAVPVGAGPSQTLTAVATDAAGNVTSQTVLINIDRAPPVVALTSPAPGAAVKGPVVAVAGTVADSSTTLVDVNGHAMTVAGGAFTGTVPVSDGALLLRATATDAAGNEAVAEYTITVDTVAPVVTITEPAPGAITNATSIAVRGNVSDATGVVIRAGAIEIVPVNGAFEAILPLPNEGTNVLVVTATDAAGNIADADVAVVADRTAPQLEITSPGAGAIVSTPQLALQGTVTDMTASAVLVNGVAVPVTGSTWETVLDGLAEGGTTVTVVARDAAANETTVTRSFTIDLNAPIVSITSPAASTSTAAESVLVSGTVQDVSVDEVRVNGSPADLASAQGSAPRAFTATVLLAEGDNTITASAVDGAGREGTAQVLVTRDSTAPSISLTVAPKVTRARPAAASIIATDNLALDRVVVSVNGVELQTFTTPPFALNIAAPESARPGDVLSVVAQAFDRVGNSAQATASLPVASDGAVVGQVLADETGLPLQNAVVDIAGTAINTDAAGRYSFATGEQRIALSVTAPDRTTVDREFEVASEAGTVAVDARLTRLNTVTIEAGSNRAIALGPNASLLVPDSIAEGTPLTVTALSGQGLPGLLPLGWSPIAALDLRIDSPVDGFSWRAANAPVESAYLARYLNGRWYLASDALLRDGDGTIAAPLPVEQWVRVALVSPDSGDASPAVPAIGEVLPGVPAQLIPLTATSAGVLDPPVLSPSGGVSAGTLTITSPTPLPSGTIVQASVTETFTLSSGDTISTDARNQDFVLYQSAQGLAATFPVAPSRSFTAAELVQGVVHLDILAGRESVRGVAGGSGAVSLTTTGATLSVSQGALTDDVPITFQSAVLSSFLPATADVAPLLEFAVDFSGRVLATGAEFSVAASQLQGVAPGDALVIARVDLIEGRSRLVPVAIGELAGDRYFARAVHGLSGVVRGGRHVWYRVAGGVGYVRGITDAGGAGLVTVVDASNLPFASMAGTSGQYTAIAREGTVTVRARAPGTSLVGEGSAIVASGAETALSISLVGAVTAASIVPVSGAINVSPAAQIEIASAASIRADSVAGALIEFQRTSDAAGPVAFRTVLSGSGRTLAIVPLTRLAEGATYSVSVSGLSDAVGGAITVPATSFTTQSNVSPVYDLEKLVFSFPNDQGQVALTGPAGTLAPGSTIMVVNESTGEVSSLPVFNDGSVGGDLVANVADRLIVTITDLQGRATTFKRSTYVAADGTTAVGAGGGDVIGAGGVEVRIPEDAVMDGVAAILKIAAVPPDQLPEGPLPDLFPGATVATSLKIESPNPPTFQKEVDLVFPKPADAPDNAVYFVYRRLVGPDGRVAYETIDYADVEGEGENAKVVTASEPFSGYINSIDGYSLAGVDHLGAVSSQLTNYAILMFYYDLLSPGRAIGGTITGKVLRPRFDPGTGTTVYDPVPGALISGVDAGGTPLFADTGATVATSQPNGTYAMFDHRYEGGAVTISATVDGVTRTATAYEVDPQNTKSPGLRFAKHVATANIVFPALPPATPVSPVQLRVLTLDENGARKPATGIVIAGEPIVIGVSAADNTVQRIDVRSGTQNAEYGVRPDPLRGNNAPNTFDVVADGSITLPTPGTYTITAHALSAFGGPVSNFVVVRATAPGGGNNESLPSDAPAVITERTVPKANATGVQIGALPQIMFTEPVQNVPAGVTLVEDGGGAVDIAISGVGPDGPIENLSNASIVTSITIQPIAGLKFGTTYTLSLSNAIVDTDDGANNTPANKPLTPYSTTFTTFMPESIGQTTDTFTAGGIAVIGDRAYVATPENAGRWSTIMRLFDVSDPTTPAEITTGAVSSSHLVSAPPVWMIGTPVDVAAEENSEWTGTNIVAVASVPLGIPYHASNVRLYDVSDDNNWRWLGAVSLGREPLDGMIRRVRLKGPTLYALTAGIGKGFQVVDLDVARSLFDGATAGGQQTADFWNMLRDLHGTNGFGQGAIMQTIPVENPGMGQNSQMWDMAILDMPVFGTTETAMIATGRSPLAIATPTQGLLYNGDILDQNGAIAASWGFAIGTGIVNGVPLAAVSALGPSGPGSTEHVLAIIDLSTPTAPRAIGKLTLPGSAYNSHDLVIRDSMVFIGTTAGTLMVNIADPMHPSLMGAVPGISGRLAFSENGLLFGTYRGLTQVTNPEGGVRSAALGGPLLFIPRVPPQVTRLVQALPGLGTGEKELQGTFVEELIKPLVVRVIAVGAQSLASGAFQLLQDGAAVAQQTLNFVQSRASITIPQGSRFAEGARLSAIASVDTDQGIVVSDPRDIPSGSARILLDSNNDTKIDQQDLEAKIDGERWAFWEAEASGASLDALQDFATIKVRSRIPIERLRIRLRGPGTATRWSLMAKRSLGLDYLSSTSKGGEQAAKLAVPCTILGFPAGLCNNDSEGWVIVRNLPPGDTEFLVRCDECPTNRDRVFELAADDQNDRAVPLDLASTDIRPMKDWLSVHTARRASGFQPRPSPILDPNWETPISPDAKTLTVLVHGFNVDSAGAHQFFKTYAKRLYWSGHPVLLPQRGSPQVIGFSWPGNSGIGKLFFQNLSNLTFFPEDEFRALQTGKVFADWIERIAVETPAQPRTIDVIAHSLGNLVVNSGLKFLPAGRISTYVMNEAAMPAEALNPDAPTDAGLVASAQEYGYPTDTVWEQQWATIVANKAMPASMALCTKTGSDEHCRSHYDQWKSLIGADKTEDQLRTAYTYRWRQVRPSPWDPDATPTGELPQRGAWRGFFADNLQKTNIVNTFSRNDQILGYFVWQLSQKWQKPNIGPLGLLPELQHSQFWAHLDNTTADEQVVFPQISPAHANVVRQWAELAHWFGATTAAAGSMETISNFRDFSSIAPSGINVVATHGYLTSEAVQRVYELFVSITRAINR